jgi:hypothetical protein
MRKGRYRGKGEQHNGRDSFPILDMIRDLPTVRAPRNFEPLLYRQLGISYMPLYKKVLIMSGSSFFSCSSYFAGKWFFGTMAERLTLARAAQFFSTAFSKVVQWVSIIKVGYHLKEILLAFANPWFFVGVALLSSLLMLLLIAIAKNGKRKAVLLSNH